MTDVVGFKKIRETWAADDSFLPRGCGNSRPGRRFWMGRTAPAAAPRPIKGNSRIANLPERAALNDLDNTVFEDAVTGLFTRGKTYNLHN